ncbi:MAG: hypothetical protein ACK4ZD_15490 [Caldimonas sp.]
MINGISYDLSIQMPDGGQIVLADWGVQPLWNTQTVRAFRNHNIFRLDQAGNVIWQVRRDEGEAFANWARMRERAEATNDDDIGTRSPFLYLWLQYANGATNYDYEAHAYPEHAQWVDGAKIWCSTLDARQYVLDPETGVAVCMTPVGIREW